MELILLANEVIRMNNLLSVILISYLQTDYRNSIFRHRWMRFELRTWMNIVISMIVDALKFGFFPLSRANDMCSQGVNFREGQPTTIVTFTCLVLVLF